MFCLLCQYPAEVDMSESNSQTRDRDGNEIVPYKGLSCSMVLGAGNGTSPSRF